MPGVLGFLFVLPPLETLSFDSCQTCFEGHFSPFIGKPKHINPPAEFFEASCGGRLFSRPKSLAYPENPVSLEKWCDFPAAR
jgi:hypothetical protein